MIIREYRAADFRRLCEIDHLCFEPAIAYSRTEMAAALRQRGALALVAENIKGEVVAFLVAEGGHIITLDVLPRYRQRGIGRRLLACCEERLRTKGIRVVELETAEGNLAAQALYTTLGYKFVKRLPRFYATGEDGWLMRKVLDAGARRA